MSGIACSTLEAFEEACVFVMAAEDRPAFDLSLEKVCR